MIAIVLAILLSSPQQATTDETKQRLAQAQKLTESGDLAQAVAALEKAVAAAPQSSEAHLALGRALDLRGDYAAARKHLEQAISLSTDETRNAALVAMAVSWAFESKPDEAARFYQRVFDAEMQANDTAGAAGSANALGRIYLESGDLAKAEQWYRTGYETSKRQPDQPASQLALWEMRWHNAQARIAARQKNATDAQKHITEVKALLDKGGNENQRVFYPYLTGYVAFYGGKYRQAIDELLQGDQKDPFVVGLIADAYDKLGDKAKAREFHQKVLALPGHSINAAFSWPRAKRFLTSSR